MQNSVHFQGGLFGFVPVINTEQLSIFNNEFKLDYGLGQLIFINLLLLLIIQFYYIYVRKKEYTNNHFEYCFLFAMAGSICSLIDKITLGGSLDYILFLNHIWDIKDIYLLLAVVSMCVYAITYAKHIN